MENDRITKIIYVGECAGSHSVDRLRKRLNDTMKDCLRKMGLDVRQARKMVHDKSICWGFVMGNAWGSAQGMNL